MEWTSTGGVDLSLTSRISLSGLLLQRFLHLVVALPGAEAGGVGQLGDGSSGMGGLVFVTAAITRHAITYMPATIPWKYVAVVTIRGNLGIF